MLKNGPIEIIQKLNQAGFEAYFVGGCVRDLLLMRPIHDWDITTSARPEQIMIVFPQGIPTGIKHGTITVLSKNMPVEITTFRCDGEYLDGRHPEQVQFVSSLHEDLVRRDFTINAFAMGQNGEIVDLFNGVRDLEKKLIRCIGNPTCRFREDALRMLRAVRFSAQLGFELELDTKLALRACASGCESLSVERIRDELEKVLLSDHPECIKTMADYGLLNKVKPVLCGDMQWIKNLTKNRIVRWAAICQHWKDLDLTKLRIDRRTVEIVNRVLNLKEPKDRLGWKKLIAENGKEISSVFAELVDCKDVFEEIMQSGECLYLSELAVRGSDFPHVKGKELGILLQNILLEILEFPENNKKEIILKKYKNSIDYRY